MTAKRKDRRKTLARMLERLSTDSYLTPGERAACAIASKLSKKTTMANLDKYAAKTKLSEPFWSKQW